MGTLADAYRKMVSAGMSTEDIAEMLAILEEGFARPIALVDQQAARRREKDRERASVRRNLRKSAESADAPLEKKGFPTPLPKTQSQDPPSPPKGGSSPILAFPKLNGFARFWEAYPRKEGKGAAERAFPKALRQIDGVHADPLMVMLGGLERAKAGWDDPKFIPHPATWLNGRRWEDEPPQPSTGLSDARRHPPPSDAFTRKQANLARAFAASGGISATE